MPRDYLETQDAADKDLRRARWQLSLFAWLITFAWVAAVSVYAGSRWAILARGDPNFVGDFLAGATAPLAFFWLIVGYFQQGMELRQNSHALLIQAHQLSLQVAETRALVKESATQAKAASDMLQLELKRSEEARRTAVLGAQPRWEADANQFSNEAQEIHLLNVGADAAAIRIVHHDDVDSARVKPTTLVRRGESLIVYVHYKNAGHPERYEILLQYVDAQGNVRDATITVTRSRVKVDHEDPFLKLAALT